MTRKRAVHCTHSLQCVIRLHQQQNICYILYKNQGGKKYVIFTELPVSYYFYHVVQVHYQNEQPCANVVEFKSTRESQVRLLTHGSWFVLIDSCMILVDSWWISGEFWLVPGGFWSVLVDSHSINDIENYVNNGINYCWVIQSIEIKTRNETKWVKGSVKC